jgi:hypothetical protein
MKTKLFYILFFVGLVSTAQNWSTVGNAQFSNNASSARLAFSPTGEPYVVYRQWASMGNRTRVAYFNGTDWIDLGDVGTVATSSQPIAFDPNDNSVWVVGVADSNGQIVLHRYDGTTWQQRNVMQVASNNRYNKHIGLYYDDNNNNPRMLFHSLPGLTSSNSRTSTISVISHSINSNSNGVARTYPSVGKNNAVAIDKNGNVLRNESNNNVVSDFTLSGTNATSFLDLRIASQETRFYDVIGNKWVAHTRNTGASSYRLEFYIGENLNAAQPEGTPDSRGGLVSIDMQSDSDVFICYSDGTQAVAEKYNGVKWSNINLPTIDSTTNGFFQQIAVNEFNDDVYYMYRENGKISILKYTPTPALALIYVDVNATGNNSGDSWANAMTSLDVALNNSESNTEEIWVAEGTYTVASRANAYTVGIDNLKIYGGFNGTETNISERDIRNHETILSGDVNNNDGSTSFIDANRQENNEHIVYVSGNNILLDGLTISGGIADSSSGNNSLGAGIFIEESVLDFTLKNSNLRDNVNFSGGALYYWPINTSTVIIENCKFTNNTARYAASMYLVTANNVNLTVNLYNNLFNHNKIRNRTSLALGSTGDVWIRAYRNNSTVTSTIINSTFSNFSSFGSNNNPVQSALVLSESDGVHTATVANSILFNNMSTTQFYDISGRSTNILASSITVLNSIG